jgi:hypothetical protein
LVLFFSPHWVFSFWIFPLFLIHSSLFAHTIYSADFFAINHHSFPSHLQS